MKPALKIYRNRAGLTQREVAERAGISTQMYQRIELGMREGKVGTWERLSAIFGIPIPELRGKPQEEWKPKKPR